MSRARIVVPDTVREHRERKGEAEAMAAIHADCTKREAELNNICEARWHRIAELEAACGIAYTNLRNAYASDHLVIKSLKAALQIDEKENR